MDRIFYSGMAAFLIALVFSGFSRTFYLNSHFAHRQLSTLLMVHGTVFSCWILLLLTQTLLVASGRVDIHRKLGYAGGFLAVTMLVLGLMAGVDAGRRGSAPPGIPPLAFMTVPIFDIVVFSTLVGAGFLWRKRPETHKRLMLTATIGIMGAAVARLPFDFIMKTGPLAFFGIADLILIVCVIYDTATRRRVHPAYIWGGLLVIVSQPLRLMVGGTAAWLTFARWLVG